MFGTCSLIHLAIRARDNSYRLASIKMVKFGKEKEAQKVKVNFKPKVSETPVVCSLRTIEKRYFGAGSREREKVERT